MQASDEPLTSSGENEGDTSESHERGACLSSSRLEGLFREVETASARRQQTFYSGCATQKLTPRSSFPIRAKGWTKQIREEMFEQVVIHLRCQHDQFERLAQHD